MMADLKGKAGIVTGGSSGIGFQIANVLAEAGATVYVISRTGRPKEGGIAAQARQALENVDEVLRDAGIDRTHLVQCRIYTPDVTYWDEIDRVYAAFLGDHKPARVVVPCGPLHYGCLVEIEAVAAMEKEDA